MKWILSQDMMKARQFKTIECKFAKIEATLEAELYSQLCDIDFDIKRPSADNWKDGVKIFADGELYGHYVFNDKVDDEKIKRLMMNLLNSDYIMLPSQEELESNARRRV